MRRAATRSRRTSRWPACELASSWLSPSQLAVFVTLHGGSLHGHLANHAVVAMVGDQAGIFERAGLGEFPDDLGRFRRRQPHAVRVVVFHVRMLLHVLGVLQVLLRGGEQEFMVFLAGIADHEAD